MALKVLTVTTEILFDADKVNAPDLWEVATDLILAQFSNYLDDFEFVLCRDTKEEDLRYYSLGEYDADGWTTEDYKSWEAQKEMDERAEQDYFGWQEELEEASKNWAAAKADAILAGLED